MHVFNFSAGVCIHVREQVRALKVVEQLCTNVFTDGALMAHNPCCCCCCYFFVQILVFFCYFVQKHSTYLIIAQVFAYMLGNKSGLKSVRAILMIKIS